MGAGGQEPPWSRVGRQRLEYDRYRKRSKPNIVFGMMGEHTVNRPTRLFLDLENPSEPAAHSDN
jgi:hypothetical protein